MQKIKSKTMAIMIAAILTISMGASMMIVVPNANAHTPSWLIKSYAYVTVAPNPVGIGQTASIEMWVDTPLPGASEIPVTTFTNDIRRTGYSLTITAPDGTVKTQTWAIVSDPTGIESYRFTPTQIGTYTIVFNYPGQTYTWTSSTPGADTSFTGDVYSAANSTTTLNVQQEPISTPLDSYPLPTSYWTYPIEGQNTYWYTIASNWLGLPYILGANSARPGAYQPYGSAPTSPHVMWTKPLGYGGVVGGNDTNVPGETFYNGLSYNTRFNNPLIMQGVLYYQEPFGNSGTGGPYDAVDLKTGQQIWSINVSATGVSLLPSFGYLYSMDQPNQHGVLPNGLLIASTTAYTGLGTVWRGYDPATGVLTTMNVTNVPGGTNVAGPSGEYLKYILTNYGTSTNPNWYLAQWNSSNVFGTILGAATSSVNNWYSGTANASLPSAYDWNVSVNLGPGSWSIGTATLGPLVDFNNIALLVQGSFGSRTTASTGPANITAINLKPGLTGKVLWTQSYPQAPGNVTRAINAWDPNTGVFIFQDKETMVHWGYSTANGGYMWGPSALPDDFSTNWLFFMSSDTVAYGNLYSAGYSGIVYCYDDSTGVLKWTYGNGGESNNTGAGYTTPYGVFPQQFVAIADGKIYVVGNEHSPNAPMYKGAQLTCLNATTGEQIWSISGWGNQMNGDTSAIASGYIAFLNTYDMQIYSYGQGPSKLTVTAPQVSIELGRSLVISGSVTDMSAGTKQQAQAANFPNGVPCVSDGSMSSWMEYVYMQKPKPINTTGVPVTISVIDSNGNLRQIGTATSDSSGMYGFTYTPDIPGQYTVIATFAGSQSYYGSTAQTYFAVDSAAPTPAPTQAPAQSTADMYFVPAVAGIIVAIAIVGVVLALLLLRKRP